MTAGYLRAVPMEVGESIGWHGQVRRRVSASRLRRALSIASFARRPPPWSMRRNRSVSRNEFTAVGSVRRLPAMTDPFSIVLTKVNRLPRICRSAWRCNRRADLATTWKPGNNGRRCWRRARVAEGTGFENRRTGNRAGGSNPSASVSWTVKTPQSCDAPPAATRSGVTAGLWDADVAPERNHADRRDQRGEADEQP